MTESDYLYDPASPPDADIAALEALLRPASSRGTPALSADELLALRPAHVRWRVPRGLAAAVTVLAIGTALLLARTSQGAPWSVRGIRGLTTTTDAAGRRASALQAGGAVQTSADGAARLAIGTVGHAELGGDTRVRLLRAAPTELRLALERGSMHASVDAPPRLFLVEAAGALATDLGCEYRLSTTRDGGARLEVLEGEVELARNGIVSVVPAGNVSTVAAGSATRPSLPVPLNADTALVRAVNAFDRQADSAAIADVVRAADARSTITLWHLLGRAPAAYRGMVYDRLAALSPPPASVTRERAIEGGSYALQRWRTELQRSWAHEPPWWRRLVAR